MTTRKEEIVLKVKEYADKSGSPDLRMMIGTTGHNVDVRGDIETTGQAWMIPGFVDAIASGVAYAMELLAARVSSLEGSTGTLLNKVKVSASDATADYLNTKLEASGGIQTSVSTISGIQRLIISAIFGTTAATICQGNDSRLTEAKPPTAHGLTHEATGSDPITTVTGLSGLLTDPQTPLSHGSSHEAAGADSIKLDNLAAPEDNTDLNVSTSAHGLMTKLDNNVAHFYNGQGGWTTPKLDDLATPDDNTDLNASTSAHGLAPKLDNNVAHFYNGQGGWTTPSGLSPLTTKGDLHGYDTGDARIPIGSNNYVLTPDSSKALGLDWKNPVDLGLTILPENIPILEYSSATVVNIVQAPGASTTLIAVLNDGARRTDSAALTVDLTVSGLGGLDTGSKAASKAYCIYLIPDVAGTGLAGVASLTDPDAGGPTGFSIWKYIGAIITNSSGNICKTRQVGNIFFYDIFSEGVVYGGNGAGYIEHEAGFAAVDISAWIPKTAKAIQLRTYIDINPEDPPAYWEIYWSIDGTNLTNYYNLRGDNEENQNGALAFLLPVTSSQTIYRRRNRASGALDLGWIDYIISAWIDGYLPSGQVQIQAEYTPDTKPLKGTWASTSTVGFGPRPGQSSTSRQTFQDGKQRTATTGTWSIANDVADWGYDENASKGNSKQLYFYEVPKSGDDNQFVVRVSDNGPATGPTGYTNFKLCWTDYINSSGELRKVHQNSNAFTLNDHVAAASLSPGFGWISSYTDYAIDDVVPLSCGRVLFRGHVMHTNSGSSQQALVIGPEGGGWLYPAYCTGLYDYNQISGYVPTTGVASKKIAVENYTWDAVINQIQHQEILFLGWMDDWIEP